MEYGQKKIKELFLHKHYKLFVSVLSIINYAYNISNNMHYYLLNLDIYSSLTTFYQVKMVHFHGCYQSCQIQFVQYYIVHHILK